jgi:hypothetical protein
MSLSGRIGQFLLFIALIILIIFFATDQAQEPVYSYFCSGIILLFAGLFLIWRNRKPPPPSERFRILRSREEKQADRNKEDDL